MTSQVVDQSPSEPRLHRALYVVKYLRAMVLNLILVVIATVLFVVVGVDNVYFLADDSIKALKALIVQQAGGQFGSSFPLIVASVTGVMLLVFFIWMYLSIVNVWRISLRIQAVYMLVSVLFAPLWAWSLLRFSFENLSLMFSTMAALSYVLMIVIVLDFVFALWRVSSSPEPSSFVATLDRRLAPSFWVFANKLVDLPRTPLRNWRTATAYVLSFGGQILQIATILYLISLGGASTKLGQIAVSCDPANITACYGQSSIWSHQILLWLVLSLLAGLPAAALMQSAAKRLGGLSVSDVLKSSDKRFILYLRPFDTDSVILPRPRLPLLSKLISFRPFPVLVEEELFDVADGYRPLIAVGKPSGTHSQVGGLAYRDYVDDSNWQNYILDKIRRAESIVILLKNSIGVRWELSRVLEEGAMPKTLFLFPPEAKEPERWQNLAREVLPFPRVFQSQALGFYFDNDTLVEIVNRNWTATSYRTAFSYFLAR
jgi:hypothetical protein